MAGIFDLSTAAANEIAARLNLPVVNPINPAPVAGQVGGMVELTVNNSLPSDLSGVLFGNAPFAVQSSGGPGAPLPSTSDDQLALPSDAGNGGDVSISVNTNINLSLEVFLSDENLSAFSLNSTGGSTADQFPSGPTRIVSGVSVPATPQVSAGQGGMATFDLAAQNTVSVAFTGTTSLNSTEFYAVDALSQGGSGGAVALGSTAPPVGGNRNDGGAGGDVAITINGTLNVSGNGSGGVLARSIGGAGGDAPTLENDIAPPLESPGVSPLAGNGGAAGSVSVTLPGAVNTSGDASPALVLQQIGGDGGGGSLRNGVRDIDAAVAALVTVLSEAGFSVSPAEQTNFTNILQQFSGGEGGNAAVDANAQLELDYSTGSITTTGKFSPAAILVSTGGRGGDAPTSFSSLNAPYGRGGAGGDGGNISITGEGGSITTTGDFSFGIYAQSVGGAGGDGSSNSGQGGAGGSGGAGGNVTVNSVGTITTSGNSAIGVVLQSIGGGGALNAFAASDFSLTLPSPGIGGEGGTSDGFFDAVGGDGGGGGAGGQIDFTMVGSDAISTSGDNAYGVFVQSLGGSGGTGGSADSSGFILSISQGGAAGFGALGGDVTVTTATGSSIQTMGLTSAGLAVHSIGGGGGYGGNADASSYSGGVGISVAIGGAGGSGNSGGDLTITNGANITTQSIDSSGIQAMTVGGSGGNGGQATAGSTTFGAGDIPSISIALAVGGTGGSGGDGGTISLSNTGSITTGDDQSHGIYGTSIGGGGGIGANASSTASSVGTGADVDLNVAIGGAGGSGGAGGTITLSSSTGTINTQGQGAYGIHLSSIGGGGGVGGTGSGASSAATNATQSIGATFAVGGNSGASSDGGAVTLTSNSANITTSGGDSSAIYIQSIGGGGGTVYGGQISPTFPVSNASPTPTPKVSPGAANADGDSAGARLNFALGGNGGQGGKGGEINVTSDGGATLSTSGDNAPGIHAQSIGGGGGLAGGASTATTSGGTVSKLEKDAKTVKSDAQKVKSFFNNEKNNAVNGTKKDDPKKQLSFSAALSVGGQGGSGGDGGKVTISSASTITTDGFASHGLFAQSLGGGGGHGAAASNDGGNTFNFGLGLGGGGGVSGNGGEVIVTNSGSILSNGAQAHGILAQSIGGGGGTGAAASAGNHLTKLEVNAEIGGNGGASGTGGTVKVTNSGSISTNGPEAHGIVAASIGGGGGHLLLSLPPALSITGGDATSSSDVLPSISTSANLKIGGDGSKGGKGGDVTVTHGGTILTVGDHSYGIHAQSIGGGGGTASGISTAGPISASLDLGGTGGTGNDAGTLTVDFQDNASIATSGTGSIGLLAQSIGGGGGHTGVINPEPFTPLLFPFAFTNSAGIVTAGGSGGSIVIQSTDTTAMNIQTTGQNAHAIFAQSLGAGGGTLVSTEGVVIPDPLSTVSARPGAIGKGGAITIDLNGTISATGSGAVGIFAQSGVQDLNGLIDNVTSDTLPNQPISITHNGSITGAAAAIRIQGGQNNTITLSGGVVSATSGNAVTIEKSVGVHTLTIDAGGTLSGNVTSDQLMTVTQSGTFYPGPTIDLAGGVLLNRGLLNVLGSGVVGSTSLNGTLEHSGQWHIDVALSQNTTADFISVNETALIYGSILVNFTSNGAELDKTNISIPVISATKGLAVLDPQNVVQNVAVDLTQTRNSAALSANFTKSVTSANGLQSAQAIQSIWNSGNLGAMEDHIVSLLNITSQAEYAAQMNSVAPESHAVQGATAPQQASRMQSALHSFPAFSGSTAMLSEETGVYARGTYTYQRHGGSGQVSGYDQHDQTYFLGGQKSLADNWFAGGLFSYSNNNIQSDDNRSNGEGDTYFVGGVVKKQITPNLLTSLSFGYSYGAFNFNRQVTSAGVPLVARGEPDLHTVSSRARASYLFDLGQWYIRPAFALDFVYVNVPGYSESGGGALNLRVQSQDDFQVGLVPELEVGGRIDLPFGILRPYASAGLTWWSDSNWSQGANLVAAGANSNFTTAFETSDILANLSLGADLILENSVELRVQYDGNYSDDFISHGLSGRIGFRF